MSTLVTGRAVDTEPLSLRGKQWRSWLKFLPSTPCDWHYSETSMGAIPGDGNISPLHTKHVGFTSLCVLPSVSEVSRGLRLPSCYPHQSEKARLASWFMQQPSFCPDFSRINQFCLQLSATANCLPQETSLVILVTSAPLFP